MAETTGISWTDATFNPWIGCTRVSPGCDGCYAAASTPARSLGVKWGAGEARRRTSPSNWMKPLRWNDQPFSECVSCGWRGEARDAKVLRDPPGFHPPIESIKTCPRCGGYTIMEARRRVFCASLADVFDNEVDPAWRADLWELIGRTPNLDWMILTKRIGNAARMMNRGAPPNVWLGASIVNQEEADRDVPKLLATPAAVRFVSYEPALGPVDFRSLPSASGIGRYLDALNNGGVDSTADIPHKLDWIIVGGESSQPGHQARPFDIQWARDTVRQCREAGVACFVKQFGSAPEWNCRDEDAEPPYWCPLKFRARAGADPAEWPADLRVMDFPAGGGNG